MPTETQHAIEFLRQDPLRNIVPLKMLALYPAAARCFYHQDRHGAGALVLLPTAAAAFDRATYPFAEYVVLIGATSQAAVRQLIAHVPRGTPLVFKLNDPADRATVAEQFAVRRATAFLSYTARPGQPFAPAEHVRVSRRIDPRCYPLFAEQGHAPADLAHYFAGDALALAVYQGTNPIAACFVYQNYQQIYEIAGVYTVPSARRRGYARQLVATALHALAERGHIPRYQVHEANHASIRLAEAIGLQQFVTIEHWITTEHSARDSL